MTIYKVVNVTPCGVLQSAFATGEALVKYPLNTIVAPPKWLLDKGYGITAFVSLADARHFYDRTIMLSLRIYIGSGAPMEFVKQRLKCADLCFGDIVRSLEHWPRGTKMFSSVVLYNEVC